MNFVQTAGKWTIEWAVKRLDQFNVDLSSREAWAVLASRRHWDQIRLVASRLISIFIYRVFYMSRRYLDHHRHPGIIWASRRGAVRETMVTAERSSRISHLTPTPREPESSKMAFY
ncbi:hypothetical protein ElyMa_000105600 [Elysia marginata]|uniref:Uncharacterized protein n=1 Tax=Elysia marginata TaxID=1093978 RepID=A0AAV4EL31_9GAST|nr:hypothetical protein ElyMa_000105600 [Elysia marginata]